MYVPRDVRTAGFAVALSGNRLRRRCVAKGPAVNWIDPYGYCHGPIKGAW